MSFWTTTTGAVLVVGAFAATAVMARSLPDLLSTPSEAAASVATSSDPEWVTLQDPVIIPTVSADFDQEQLCNPARNLIQHAAAESSAMTAYPIVP